MLTAAEISVLCGSSLTLCGSSIEFCPTVNFGRNRYRLDPSPPLTIQILPLVTEFPSKFLLVVVSRLLDFLTVGLGHKEHGDFHNPLSSFGIGSSW